MCKETSSTSTQEGAQCKLLQEKERLRCIRDEEIKKWNYTKRKKPREENEDDYPQLNRR